METLLKKFNLTGNCIIDVEKTCKRWKDYWFISEYDSQYTIIIPDRRSSERTLLKAQISANQSAEIIKKLELKKFKSSIFKSGATWKTN